MSSTSLLFWLFEVAVCYDTLVNMHLPRDMIADIVRADLEQFVRFGWPASLFLRGRLTNKPPRCVCACVRALAA